MQTNGNQPSRSRQMVIIPLLIYALLLAAYPVLRYAGHFVDGDTAYMTTAIRNLQAQGTVIPQGEAYGAGPTYPLFSTVLLMISGVSVRDLQLILSPFLASVLVLSAAYPLFHVAVGSWQGALLATFLLFLQPEFLFHIFRGSHEKLTWTLMMIALLILFKSTGTREWRTFGILVLLFYLVVFALITVNSFVALSFVAAILLASIGGQILHRLGRVANVSLAQTSRRFLYITFSSSILAFMFVFYLYGPARSLLLRSAESGIDRVAILLLNVEARQAVDPYAVIGSDWISSGVYLGLTVFTWTMLPLSFLEWLRRGKAYLFRGERAAAPALLLWLLYAAFVVQFVLSVALDQTGVLGGNLQLRVLLPLSITAVPLVSSSVLRLLSWHPARARARVWLLIPLLLFALWLAAASLLKGTSDPVLSNNWLFYADQERDLVFWVEARVRNAEIWEGPDVRLGALRTIELGTGQEFDNHYWGGWLGDATGYFCISPLIRAYSARLERPLPDVGGQNLVYDNGFATLYHRRPRTPYQR